MDHRRPEEREIYGEANLSEAKNLTAGQVRSAKNWCDALLPDYLKTTTPA